MDKNNAFNILTNIVGDENCFKDICLENYTTFKIGGPADIFVTPEDYESVAEVVRFAKKYEIPFFYLGNGSNVLVKDRGYRGIIINFSKLNKITLDGNKIIAQSGASLKDVSNFALENSLTGLEFACGIPGTVGGASAMNAGAYNGEVKNVIENILMVNGNDEIRRVYVDELNFGYRKSLLLQENYAALEVCYSLQPGNREAIKNRIDELTKWRTDKQPLEYPSAGSTFKRPEGFFTGKLIQDAGLKGYSLGGAQISPKHAGFVINSNKATAEEVIQLISYIIKNIKEKYNIELSPEVRIIGE